MVIGNIAEAGRIQWADGIGIARVEASRWLTTPILHSHDGPVWQVSWAHPKFGNILASASYDGKVFIWQERQGQFSKLTEHANHHASGISPLPAVRSRSHQLVLVWGPMHPD